MAEIWSLIKAIPAIVGLLKEVMHWFKMHVGDGDPVKFIGDVSKGFEVLNNAKTPEEKQNAAKVIQSLIRRT